MNTYNEAGSVARGRKLVQHAAVLLYADRPLKEFLSHLQRLLKETLSAEALYVALRGENGKVRRVFGDRTNDERRVLDTIKSGEPSIERHGAVSSMFVPIFYGGDVIGVASVESSLTQYTDEDVRLMSALCDYIAIAVSNQDLVRSVLRPYRRLRRAALLLLAAAIVMSIAFAVLALLRAHQLARRSVDEAQTHVNSIAYRLQTYVYDAAQLSRSLAALAPDLRGDRRRTERVLLSMIGSAPSATIYGGGLWYEPYAYDGHSRLYGPYVHRKPKNRKEEVLTYFWSSLRYNYPTQPWYRLAKFSHGETRFTNPYFDIDLTYITAAQPFYDSRGRFLGVATVGMVLPFLQHFIATASQPPARMVYMTTNDGKTFAFPNAPALIAFARSGDSRVSRIQDVSPAEVNKYLISRFSEPRVETTATVPLVGWTLHESELSRSFYNTELYLWIWTGLGLLALWISTALGLRGILRARKEVLERVRLEIEHSRLRNEVAQRLEAEQRLREVSKRDDLTGVPARIALFDLVATALEERRSTGQRAAVLFVDLDHFSAVNEALGHTAGDEVLRSLAQRLIETLGKRHIVGRYGGDEFLIIARVDRDGDAEHLAELVLAALSRPFVVERHTVFLRASVGIAEIDSTYESPMDVVRDADLAMYRAKSKGTLHFEVFDAEMRAQAVQRVRVEAQLRQSVARDEFFVEYQPIVQLDSGEVAGFEALVRWRLDGSRTLYPQEFIDSAERIGVIIPIDYKVLEIVKRDFGPARNAWRDKYVAVNASALHFATKGMAQHLVDTVASLGFDRGALHLELTETALMGDPAIANDAINALRGAGTCISIDDFGTGYSSLAYVERFQVDALKIDKSFIESLGRTAQAAEIVRAVNALGKALGLRVIAEGIETSEQLSRVRESGIRYGQGFLFSKPVPFEQATEMLTVSSARQQSR